MADFNEREEGRTREDVETWLKESHDLIDNCKQATSILVFKKPEYTHRVAQEEAKLHDIEDRYRSLTPSSPIPGSVMTYLGVNTDYARDGLCAGIPITYVVDLQKEPFERRLRILNLGTNILFSLGLIITMYSKAVGLTDEDDTEELAS